ncbi:MAG: hypothetical protein LBR23_09375 [Spirochaetaceae bacterium]|jgi:hypothetical protein|nr:hypothetical protein [Spirochaetaceae bacterium]
MKKYLVILLLFSGLSAFAQEIPEEPPLSYRIADVSYTITGKTKEWALAREISINKNRVFAEEKDLAKYLDERRLQLHNERSIESADLRYELLDPVDGIVGVNVFITIKDTFNFIVVPYPKYSSNSGLDFRFKLKDFNFFGTLQTLTADLTYLYDEDEKQGIGIGVDFDLPFNTPFFEFTWTNSYSLDYKFDDARNEPEFSLRTGFAINLPFESLSFRVTATQGLTQEFDYAAAGDKLYATESASVSLPFKIAETENLSSVYMTPNIHVTYHWDRDGINHPDLLGPAVGPGITISSSRVNWVGNFRDGVSLEIGQNFDYNFHPTIRNFTPLLWGDVKFFKAFKHIGFASHIYAFAYHKGTQDIGGRLRGIRDDLSGDGEPDTTDTSMGVVLNLDLPFKVVQTHWSDWGKAVFHRDMPRFFNYLDFEFQVSPFIDLGFSRIPASQVPDSDTDRARVFDYRDGWYAAGIEALVFPSSFRSITVRASLGFDLLVLTERIGEELNAEGVRRFVRDNFNRDIHRARSLYELFIGIGLHY